MRIGCCMPRERMAAAREAGFDFAELTVVDNLRPLEGEGTWRGIRREIEAAGLPVEATNVFFPGDWRLLGPTADQAAIRAYVETALRRAAELGVAAMVFGSGRARSAPEGLSQREALQQLGEVLRLMGEIAARHGVTIALEPLRRAESNLVHTVAEALDLVRPLGLPAVRVLADFYHMDEEQEPLDDLLLASGLLAHVHLADTGRLAPGTGRYDYPGLIRRLHEIGYQGRVSVECHWRDWGKESREAVGFLRDMARR